MQTANPSLNILYVGTLPPHPGGSAIVGAQLLTRLAEQGHMIRALAPITAAARLLLASDIAAAREVIVDGENGWLFRKGDVDALAAKTVLAAAHGDVRAAVGRRAREMITAHDLNTVAMAYARTFTDIVQCYPG